MTFSVAIRTVPQRKELFGALMARLAVEPIPVPVHVSSNADVAPNENGCLAIQKALGEPAHWILFLEDDAGLINDFFGSTERWLKDHARPDVHVYPLGCQYPLSNDPEVTAWEYPLRSFYCSVALLIRATLAPSLLAYMRCNDHVRQGFDLMTGHWHRTVSDSPHLITPVPCFVEHLGDVSTLIDGRPDKDEVGRFQCFRGFDFSYRRNGG